MFRISSLTIAAVIACVMSGGGAVAEISDDAVDYMMDPPDAAIYEQKDGYSTYRATPMTPAVRELVRRVVLVQDAAEAAAPRFHPLTPFGSEDGWGDYVRAFGTSDDLATAKAAVGLIPQLYDFQQRAQLAPGTYALRNISAESIRQRFAYLEVDDAYLGLTPSGEVIVTEDHLALLREMLWEWPNEYDIEDMTAFGAVPAPMVDPKRPYGDMGYFQLDVHRILGWPVEQRTEEGWIRLTEAQDEAGARLHTQMLGVMQVFLERAELPN